MKARTAMLTSGMVVMSVQAQTELNIYCTFETPTRVGIVAELRNPTGTVLAAISDLGFRIEGWGISDFQYNPAFDSDFFGPASVFQDSNTIEFFGTNTLPPLNNASGVDSSNPLQIGSFELTGRITNFELVGQVTGAYAGAPFPEILIYQNADGSSGNTDYSIYCFPTPDTAAVLGLAGIAAGRRRR
ncbi:MAG: hypothetical protein Phyf2KO_03320 [Phycisphaerales bacterium]